MSVFTFTGLKDYDNFAHCRHVLFLRTDDSKGEWFMIEQIAEVIENEVRPALQADGGDIELVDVEDGIVKVKLVGACAHCPSSALTLYNGVEKMLLDKFPDHVKGIEQVFE
jgi:Fe-S cluster biogenesis protein NfuA